MTLFELALLTTVVIGGLFLFLPRKKSRYTK